MRNNSWKVSSAKFHGYVKAKLETMHEDINKIEGCVRTNRDNIAENKRGISNITVTAAVISGLTGLIAAIIAIIASIKGRILP